MNINFLPPPLHPGGTAYHLSRRRWVSGMADTFRRITNRRRPSVAVDSGEPSPVLVNRWQPPGPCGWSRDIRRIIRVDL